MSLKLDDILKAIKIDTVDNADTYVTFSDYLSTDILIRDMETYVYNRHYNTSFGDLIPYIIANSMKMNIIIISKPVRYELRYISSNNNQSTYSSSYVFIYYDKKDLHYDAILSEWCSKPAARGITNEDMPITTVPSMASNPGEHSGVSMSSHRPNELLTNESLRILFWNINGLSQDKLHDDILGKLCKTYDIILLAETWSKGQDDFALNGFHYFDYSRKYSHPNCKRNSGGLGIFARVSIKNGLRPWCHIDDMNAWFILDKSVFGLENDLYLGCVYIVPENSTYLKHNECDLLLDDVAKIPSECGILLCGDYNARTNVLSDHDDYVSGNDGDLRNLMPTQMGESCHMISVLNEMGRLVRFSRDKTPANRHGSRLIDFCKATDLIIFNGRLGHDHGLGEFTRDDTTGRSVVDYAIGSPVIFNQVNFFKVLDKVPESDHRPLSISLSINYHCDNDKQIEEPE